MRFHGLVEMPRNICFLIGSMYLLYPQSRCLTDAPARILAPEAGLAARILAREAGPAAGIQDRPQRSFQ